MSTQKNKIRLTAKGIKLLQKNHKIKNLLNPSEDDTAKIADVDFLVDFYYVGTRHWDEAQNKATIEETVGLDEMLDAFKGIMGKG